jgi:GDPmannose 4,6-dehydratase
MSKSALSTGLDGSYLEEFLLEKGNGVHAIKHLASLVSSQSIYHIYEHPNVDKGRFKLHCGDLTCRSNLTRILSEVQPGEV